MFPFCALADAHAVERGGDASVDGNFNSLSLTGDCQQVSVNGNRNDVSIESAVSITVLGNENEVTWSRGVGGRRPEVANFGSDNAISRKPQ